MSPSRRILIVEDEPALMYLGYAMIRPERV